MSVLTHGIIRNMIMTLTFYTFKEIKVILIISVIVGFNSQNQF